jgi:hypothetical protein
MYRRVVCCFLLFVLSGCIFVPPSTLSPQPFATDTAPAPVTEEITPTLETETGGTPEIVYTLEPSITSTSELPQPTATIIVLPTPFIVSQYVLQTGSPQPTVNFLHPESACDWMGVGGQVFDTSGRPVSNLIIKLTGTLDGAVIELIALTGGAIYLGPGGYEFKLADLPTESSGTLWLTIYNDQGEAISDPITFTTFQDCDKNFILVNFAQVLSIKNGYTITMPIVEVNIIP